MMKNILFRKYVAALIIFLFVGLAIIPSSSSSSFVEESNTNSDTTFLRNDLLDMQFIYSITENLSNIIFTEYNESAGEIAKGRAFGSKGEHKAAEILEENFSKLGLWTIKEQIQNIQNPSIPSSIDEIMYPLHELTHAYEVLDYELKITNLTSNCNETVDCQISSIEVDPENNPEQIHNHSYKGLKVRKRPRSLDEWKQTFAFDKKGEDYLFIEEYGKFSMKSRNPDVTLSPVEQLLRQIFYPIRSITYKLSKLKPNLEKKLFFSHLHYYKGAISYDFNNDTHDQFSSRNGKKLPYISINGTTGRRIIQDIDNYTVDFYVKQRLNKSVISYNVIGQLNGTDPSKTVIVDCLYDSVWCQGTADSAIGMAIVMGIAKYFTDHNITPKYNMKFIGFCGEEAGNRGARYYEATHRNEDIIYVIDMNQVGFRQEEPRLTLNIIGNRLGFINEIWPIVEKTNYAERVGNTDITKRWWPEGVLSNQYVFNHRSKTVCFLKDFPWVLHHRDGLNHTAGDVLDYFDWNDTMATGEIVLNVTLYLTNNSKEQITTTTLENYFLPEATNLWKFLRRE